MFREEKVRELLKSNFELVRKDCLSEAEIEFLSQFFDIRTDEEDYEVFEGFIMLVKKPIYVGKRFM